MSWPPSVEFGIPTPGHRQAGNQDPTLVAVRRQQFLETIKRRLPDYAVFGGEGCPVVSLPLGSGARWTESWGDRLRHLVDIMLEILSTSQYVSPQPSEGIIAYFAILSEWAERTGRETREGGYSE
jgi:hypothetical protein